MQKSSSGCYFQNTIDGLYRNLDFTLFFFFFFFQGNDEILRFQWEKKLEMEKHKFLRVTGETQGNNIFF